MYIVRPNRDRRHPAATVNPRSEAGARPRTVAGAGSTRPHRPASGAGRAQTSATEEEYAHRWHV